MKQILNTIFLKDCIDSLDERYKSSINKDLTKYFSYANIFDLPLYYNLFTLKKNPDYNLYNKLHENKIIETIKVATKPKIRGTQKRHGGFGSVVAQIRGRI